MKIDEKNELFGLAAELVIQTSRNLFLTGKAGTGKTTFLKYIRENCPKQLAVVAPTGVAAINAGGVTIHSFFQLPFTPFLPESGSASPGNGQELLSRLRLNSEKKKVLKELELLIIDEVSMVRCDIVDAIDLVLRHVRSRKREPFGGVQVVFIGDMYQLPPVVKEPEWRILCQSYDAPFFFNSVTVRENPPLYIEFEHIYRQTDPRFIDVLNKVRNNQLDHEALEILDSRFDPSFHPVDGDEFILLTTHNDTARNINSRELEKLNSRSFVFRAEIKGEFSDSAFPADELLELKVGAQVMFLKNDSEREKRFFNGKIGIVTHLEENKIMVKCKDQVEIDVLPEVWKNIKYSVDAKTRTLDEEELGSYSQYPLRLAWAITIHKSQGLTFDKAIVDAGQSFAAGQVYVALSRCRSLEGMVLRSRIRRSSLLSDARVVRFSETAISSIELKAELQTAILETQEQLAIQSFDVSRLIANVRELGEYMSAHASSYNENAVPWIQSLSGIVGDLAETSVRFQQWMQVRFSFDTPPGENAEIRERSKRAGNHFVSELGKIIDLLRNSPVESDSLEHSKAFNDWAREIFAEASIKIHLLSDFDGRFNVVRWYQRKDSFELPSFKINAYSASREVSGNDSPHPVLYQKLRLLRDSICRTNDLPVYMVASGASLNDIVRYLPLSLEQLKGISGFGEARVKRFGNEFIQIVQEYCTENNLESKIESMPVSRRTKRKPREAAGRVGRPDTKAETLRMFFEGKGLAEIASERELTLGTIETHIEHFIAIGQLGIETVLPLDKVEAIRSVVEGGEAKSLTEMKLKLGDDVSFGEIRMTIASLKAAENPS